MKKTNIDYEKLCLCCEHSQPIFDEDTVLCDIKGIVSCDHTCRKFIYDALKRIPPKKIESPKLEYVDIDEEPDASEKRGGIELIPKTDDDSENN